jgi:penicillin-binding protein 2
MPRLTIKNQAQEKRLFRARLWVAVIVLMILSLTLIGRLFYLQVIKHRYYQTQSRQNIINLVPIVPKRGLVYDRNGVLLAKNVPVFSLMVTPDKTTDLSLEIKQFQKLIPLSPGELEAFNKQLHQHRQFQDVPLKTRLSDKQIADFAVNQYQFPGFAVKAELVRQYPQSALFAHTLGYVGRVNDQDLSEVDLANYAGTNYIGKTGIEKYYESSLHGVVGYKRVEIDASGRIIRTLGLTPAEAGEDLYLTLDSHLQRAAFNALDKKQGAIVAIDPNSGQVLAMVSRPSFDPNLFVDGISNKAYQALQKEAGHPLYNRTILGLYSIGSTIKPFIALEGLDSGITTPTDRIFDPGWFRIPHTKRIFHDWMRGGHGWVNIHKAIVDSCDTYFYNLAYHLGITPIDQVLARFGFGETTDVDLVGELKGTVPSPAYKMRATGRHWYTGDTVNTIIGQGFSQATPLQLANATAALAMHGLRFQPYLLYAFNTSTGQRLKTPFTYLPAVNLHDSQNWDIVIKAMQDVIPWGTGFRFGRHAPYSVAAKTGTAQVRNDNGRYVSWESIPFNQRSNSIFIAFAPVKHPKIAVAVIVEHEPEAGAALARKVIDAYLLAHKVKESGHGLKTTQS